MPKPLAAPLLAVAGLACLSGCQTNPEERVYSFEGDMLSVESCQPLKPGDSPTFLQSIEPSPGDTLELNDSLRICFSGRVLTPSHTYYGYSGPAELGYFDGVGSGTYVEMTGKFSSSTHCLVLNFDPNASPRFLEPGIYAAKLTLNRVGLCANDWTSISFGEFGDDGQSIEAFSYFLKIE